MKPKKKLGQNFLIDKNIIRKIIDTFNIKESDNVVEIGGGKGSLTEELVKIVKNLMVVEVDSELVKFLQDKFPEVKILFKNILECDFEKDFFTKPYRLIGNLPYNITSQILFKVFDNRKIITDCLFMVQKEVAERMVASPESKTYGILSIFTQFYSKAKIEFYVTKNVFFPKPEVDSAVISLKINRTISFDDNEDKVFKQLVRTAFNQRRKTLKNALQKYFENYNNSLKIKFFQIDFDFSKRPEQLKIEDFVYLAKNFFAIQKSINN